MGFVCGMWWEWGGKSDKDGMFFALGVARKGGEGCVCVCVCVCCSTPDYATRASQLPSKKFRLFLLFLCKYYSLCGVFPRGVWGVEGSWGGGVGGRCRCSTVVAFLLLRDKPRQPELVVRIPKQYCSTGMREGFEREGGGGRGEAGSWNTSRMKTNVCVCVRAGRHVVWRTGNVRTTSKCRLWREEWGVFFYYFFCIRHSVTSDCTQNPNSTLSTRGPGIWAQHGQADWRYTTARTMCQGRT